MGLIKAFWPLAMSVSEVVGPADVGFGLRNYFIVFHCKWISICPYEDNEMLMPP